METVNIHGIAAFISEDKRKISFSATDIVEYELVKCVDSLFENNSVYGAVTFDTQTELHDFLAHNSEEILKFYKNMNII